MSNHPEGPRRPSLSLVRELTDRHVIGQLLQVGELTRAELAARTRISKPTISESVRRLTEAGLLTEAGQQLGRRGPAGTYVRLRSDVGVAVALSAGPDGVLVDVVDPRGQPIARSSRAVAVPTTQAELEPLLRRATEEAVAAATGPVLAAAVSVAGPVDRATGALVRLPDSPFLADGLDPVPLLTPVLGRAPDVDNDVDWAALAERETGVARGLDEFAYLFLGPGLGGAVVSGGSLVHGGRGLAGEIAHVRTTGPGGQSLRMVECFGHLGLRRSSGAALDVPRIQAVLDGTTAPDRAVRDQVINALAGAIASLGALLDPGAVVVGGPWGRHPALVDGLADAVAEAGVVPTEIRFAALGPDAPHLGARLHAVRAAQLALTG